MGSKKFSVTNRLNAGKGQGAGASYTPWLSVNDVPSTGISGKFFGIKTRRHHHTLSKPEKYCYLQCEFNQNVVDIREQFPLYNTPLILELCQKLNIKVSKQKAELDKSRPRIFTTDLLITKNSKGKVWYEAISVKNKISSLITKTNRSLQLQEVERLYWAAHGVAWKLFIPDDLAIINSKNIEFITSPIRKSGHALPNDIKLAVLKELRAGTFQFSLLSSQLASQLDLHVQLVKQAIAEIFFEHLIEVDLSIDIKRLDLISVLSINNIRSENNPYGNIA